MASRLFISGFAILVWALTPAAARPLSILLPTDPALPALALVGHDQTTVVSDQVARTTIRQTFRNPHSRDIEAHYLFPIPKGAQVTEVSMVIDGQRVRGEVLESAQARAIYEDIVRRMRDPALIEYMDENLLRLRVYPVPARGEQTLDLELAQVLVREGALTRFEFPVGLDPAASGVAVGPDAVRLAVEVRSNNPLGTVYSPTHRVEIERADDGRSASVRVAPEDLAGRRVFVLYYGDARRDVGLDLVAHRPEADAPGTFMLLLSPSHDDDDGKHRIPRDVTFVVDVSGSMAHGGKMEQARAALTQCVGMARDDDRFNIVAFSTEVEAMADGFLPADAASRRRAESYIAALRARGGTNIQGALAKALDAKSDPGRLHVVVFLTDGQPTVGETVPRALVREVERRNVAHVRIFTFGIGYDVNAPLLDDIAAVTRASADYIAPEEDIEQKVSAFFEKVGDPILAEGRLEIPGVEVFDVYPKTLPDLFAGRQLIVFGRYRGAGASSVALVGKRGEKTVRIESEATFPDREPANAFVEPLWGARKIGYLLDHIRRDGENEELREEVVRLAKRYNVVTPYTSFLVVEDEPVVVTPVQRLPGRPVTGTRPTAAPSEKSGRYDLFSRSLGTASAPATAMAPLGAVTGRAAVDQSLHLRDLRESDSLSFAYGPDADSATTRRHVAGFDMVRDGEVWRDARLDTATSTSTPDSTPLPVLLVRFGSSAYFEILQLRPDLIPVLRLGERLVLRLENAILEIHAATGIETLSDKERALLAR